MIGIVIVSKNKQLAAGIRELAMEATHGRALIAIGAGVDNPIHPMGTDAVRVMEAIESVFAQEGVVVFMDSEEAVYSTELALELLDTHKRDKVRLCAAPLVEGSIAAAKKAAGGANIDAVIKAARYAYHDKMDTLNSRPHAEDPSGKKTMRTEVVVHNKLGLHARPATKFVATCHRFDAHISVSNVSTNSRTVNAKSINSLVTLGVRMGHTIAITATGHDAEAAVETLIRLVTHNFGEKQRKTSTTGRKAAAKTLSGLPASPNIAIGPVFHYHPVMPEIVPVKKKNAKAEWHRILRALNTAKHQITQLRQKAVTQVGEEDASIFDAHLLCLEDPELISTVRQRIEKEKESAECAWKHIFENLAKSYGNLPDPYLRERAGDILDIGQRVLRLLVGASPSQVRTDVRSILVATDLTPSETVQLDTDNVLGICTVAGGPNSHSGILARSLGIPAVVGVGAELLKIRPGTRIAIDGEQGKIWVDPALDLLEELELLAEHQSVIQQSRRVGAHEQAKTKNGRHIPIMANIGSPAEARRAITNGAEGCGLVRSEFLYFDRLMPPGEDEQLEIFRAIAQIFHPLPIVIRTMDIGGDKPLGYLNLDRENNPYLGWRGIRLSLGFPQLMKTHLRAILRASALGNVKIMFPMIATAMEVILAKQMLEEVKAELKKEGFKFDPKLEVGIMIEVPAAAECAENLAPLVDFFSIGTNDLSQYTMAADRTNAKVAALADPLEPAVLRLIAKTTAAARQHHIWVGLCGELGSDPLATPLLVGLGIGELSMNAASVAAVKDRIAQIDEDKAAVLAQQALNCTSAIQVRQLLSEKENK